MSLFQPQVTLMRKAQGIQKTQWGMELEPGSWNLEKGGGVGDHLYLEF